MRFITRQLAIPQGEGKTNRINIMWKRKLLAILVAGSQPDFLAVSILNSALIYEEMKKNVQHKGGRKLKLV